jgi:uncharacterized membrane protein required for colicin V production
MSKNAAAPVGCERLDMNLSLDHLPINLFDLALLVVLTVGIVRGRKHGMSEELLSLLTWLTVLFGCALIYQPGADLIGQFTNMFSRLSCYLLAYLAGAGLIFLLFVGIKRLLGGKLLGSDIFGRAEYYLGMGSGLVRFTCMLLAALALLNARYFSPAEVRAMEARDIDIYGSDFFPGLHSLQATVFDKSLTGPWIKENLGFLLIKSTAPENKELHQKDYVFP